VNVKKLIPRALRTCVFFLGALQIASLLLAFEPRAMAYVDPGSGFVFLQVAGSMCAGALYYLRHRQKRVLYSFRRSPVPEESNVMGNQR
jgi:hypothetical protein